MGSRLLRLRRLRLRPAYYQFPVYGGRGYDRGGSIRLQVSPRQAEVFVDGYFAGTVDDFDGTFQRLNIEAGEHEIQVYLAGYRPFSQRFYLQPGKTFNIKHTLETLGPGEPAPPRPNGAPSGGPYFGPGRDRDRETTTTEAGAVAAHVGQAPVAARAVRALAADDRVERQMVSDRSRCGFSRLMLTC